MIERPAAEELTCYRVTVRFSRPIAIAQRAGALRMFPVAARSVVIVPCRQTMFKVPKRPSCLPSGDSQPPWKLDQNRIEIVLLKAGQFSKWHDSESRTVSLGCASHLLAYSSLKASIQKSQTLLTQQDARYSTCCTATHIL